MINTMLKHLMFLFFCLFYMAHAQSCNNKVTFPVTAFKGFMKKPAFTWQTNVFGIKIVATNKSKIRLQHVAQVLAELLDNDNDGCPDDAKVHKLLMKGRISQGKVTKPLILIADTMEGPGAHFGANSQTILLEKAGFHYGQSMSIVEVEAKCTYRKVFQEECYDATQEELTHFIHEHYAEAYPKYFDNKWYANGKTSNLTRAMDKARDGRINKSNPKYSKKAWYRYSSDSCQYNCQAIEYLWWGYVVYSGTAAGLDGKRQSKEFKYMKKADLLEKDKALAKLFQDSENGKVPYKIPFRQLDGFYNGCATCKVAGLKNSGGTVVGLMPSTTVGTTRATVATTTVATTEPTPPNDGGGSNVGTPPNDGSNVGTPPPMEI